MNPAARRLLLAIAATAAAAAPLLVGRGVDFPDDALYYELPAWEWLRRAIADGRPIWFVPGKLGGVSLFADVFPMGPLYPACWLSLLLPTVPALGLAALLHALGTLLGVRWMALAHGASDRSATLAGAAVVLGPLGSTALIDFQLDSWPTFAWFPVVLGCSERAAAMAVVDRRARLRWIALGGMALAALCLGSHLRLSASVAAVLVLWAAVRWRDPGGMAAIVALGVGAGAPGWLPMLLEAGVAAEGATPALLAGPIDQALGPSAVSGWLSPALPALERGVSLGTALGLFALAGLSARGPGGSRDSQRIGAVAAVLLLAGSHVPGVRLLFAPLLVLSWPVNLVWPVLATYPLAILANRGLDRVLAMEPDARAAWLRGAGGAALGLLVGASVLRVALGEGTFPSRHGFLLQAASLAQSAVVLGVMAALLLRRGQLRHVPDLLFAAVLIDLSAFAVRSHLAVPSTPLRSAADAVTGPLDLLEGGYLDVQDLASGFDSSIEEAWTAASDPLERRTLAGAAVRRPREEEIAIPELDGPAMQADLTGRTWPPHLGMSLGIRGLAGRSKLTPERQLAALRPLAEAVHDTEAVAFVLQELFGHPGALGAATLALHGIPSAVWGDLVAFRIEDTAPLCYAPLRVEQVDDRDRRVQRLLADIGRIDRRTALVEAPLPTGLDEPRPPPERLACSEDGTTDVSAAVASLVVRRERWHPGWRVRLQDGRRLPAVPVNQVHMGVVAPPGSWRLGYRFVPPGLSASLALASAGWLLLGTALLLGAATPRRARRQAGPRVAAGCLALAAAIAASLSSRPAGAATIEGVVEAPSPHASYEVWLTSSLDIPSNGPLAKAQVDPATGRFRIEAEGRGDAWLFLRERIEPAGGPTFQLVVPFDLRPFSLDRPPAKARIRSIPPFLATLRQRGAPMPGWWLVPAFAAVLGLGTALLVRYALAWHLEALAGARALLNALRKPGQEPSGQQGSALLDDLRAAPRLGTPAPPFPSPGERRRLAGVLLLALALRLHGVFAGSLDLMEHTYGPGSRRIGEAGPGAADGLATLAATIFQPSSVEVTHPPLYHWLLGLIGLLSDAEWAIRLPSLLASLLAAWTLWTLMRRVSPAVGLLSAGLYAVAAPAIHFGHDATPYALLALVAVGSLELLLRALERGSARSWRAWLALLVAGFLCHYATAFIALAQVATVGVGALLRLRRPAWAAAAHRALGAAIVLSPLPLLWSCVHFAWFAPVSVDTRLFSAVYPADPGLAVFASRFVAVTCGVPPGATLAAAATCLLAVWGLLVVWRRDRQLGLLLLTTCSAFAGGVYFFWSEQVSILDGRVYWGFRWVSWMQAPLLGLAAAGFAGSGGHRAAGRRTGRPAHPGAAPARTGCGPEPIGPGPPPLKTAADAPAWPRQLAFAARCALLATWAASALPFTAGLGRSAARPDYAGAAGHVLSDLRDGDAVATLPAWGQQGPLTWYLARTGRGRFTEIGDGLMGWDLGGRRALLEVVHEGLPFESSARNAWFERLWVAVVDERVFGQEKFDLEVADRAIAWAREHLILEDEVHLPGVHLYRFGRTAGDLVPPDGISFGPPEVDLSGLRWLEPNAPGCQQSAPGAPPTWSLNVRIPLGHGPTPRVRVDRGSYEVRSDPGHWTAVVEGGPCSGPPPIVHVLP